MPVVWLFGSIHIIIIIIEAILITCFVMFFVSDAAGKQKERELELEAQRSSKLAALESKRQKARQQKLKQSLQQQQKQGRNTPTTGEQQQQSKPKRRGRPPNKLKQQQREQQEAAARQKKQEESERQQQQRRQQKEHEKEAAAAAAAATVCGEGMDVEERVGEAGDEGEQQQLRGEERELLLQQLRKKRLEDIRQVHQRRRMAVAAAAGGGGAMHPWVGLLGVLSQEEVRDSDKVLDRNRRVGTAARLTEVPLLPESLWEGLEGKLAEGRGLERIYGSPEEVPGFRELPERHEEVKGWARQYILQRHWLKCAKQQLAAKQYRGNLATFQGYMQQVNSQKETGGFGGGGGAGGGSGPGTPSMRGEREGSLRSQRSLHPGGLTIKSEYEEEQLMRVFKAIEDLKNMSSCPEQVIDPWEKRWRRFVSTNGLVEDPERELQEDKVRGRLRKGHEH